MKIVFLTVTTSIEEPPRARHQLADALSELGHTVYFVARNCVGIPRLERRKAKNMVHYIQPYWPLDYRFRYRLPLVNETYQLWLIKKLKALLVNVDLVVTFDFSGWLYCKYFDRVVYYCHDDFAGNSNAPVKVIEKYHTLTEKYIAKHSLFCVATSSYLKQKLDDLNGQTHLIPLGAPSIKQQMPWTQKNRKSRSNIVVGLLGYVNKRSVPLDCLYSIAKCPGLSLRIVGPVNRSLSSDLERFNVDMQGVLVDQRLAEEMSQWDVAIAPYIADAVNKGGTPNKLWQYLGCGVPSVVTLLPNLVDIDLREPIVYFAEDNSRFISLIRRAYEEDTLDLRSDRLRIARENSWLNRASLLLSIAGALLAKRGASD